MIIFPIMLLAGFVMHPDILSFQTTHSAEGLAKNFYNQPLFHIGHLIVFFAVFFIILSLFGLMLLSIDIGKKWLIYGGLIGVFGAVILAGDKGALCLVLSAFDTLSPLEIQKITPALEAIVQRKGLLIIFYTLPLLTLGAAGQFIGLIKGKKISPAAGIITIIGLLLLNNPDIEIISSIGAIFMGIGYIPLGIKFLKGREI